MVEVTWKKFQTKKQKHGQKRKKFRTTREHPFKSLNNSTRAVNRAVCPVNVGAWQSQPHEPGTLDAASEVHGKTDTTTNMNEIDL